MTDRSAVNQQIHCVYGALIYKGTAPFLTSSWRNAFGGCENKPRPDNRLRRHMRMDNNAGTTIAIQSQAMETTRRAEPRKGPVAARGYLAHQPAPYEARLAR